MIMSQPLLARLAAQDPGACVDVLAPGWTAGLCARLPGVGACLSSPFGHGELKLLERFRLGRSLARRGYQRVYVLPNSIKSALAPWFAGIPARVGYIGESRYGLLNGLHSLDKLAVPRMVDRYYALGFAPGEAPALHPAPDPVLRADPDALAASLARLAIPSFDQGPLVLCPGAEFGPAKRWPVRHFAAAAAHALRQGVPVWILGSAKDRGVADAIVAGAAQSINLCGRTDLSEAIDLMSVASGVITNDSGLMHMAAALRVPTVAVFGSSSAQFTPPLSPRARALSLGLACSPCFARECPLGHLDCLEGLLPEQVLDALAAMQAPTAQ